MTLPDRSPTFNNIPFKPLYYFACDDFIIRNLVSHETTSASGGGGGIGGRLVGASSLKPAGNRLAASFDGVTGYASLASLDNDPDSGGSPGFTVACWFNSASLTQPGTGANAARVFEAVGPSGASFGLGLCQQNTTGVLEFYSGTTPTVNRQTSSGISINRWYWFCFTYDYTTPVLYLDGVSQTVTTGTRTANGFMLFGANGNTPTGNWAGSIANWMLLRPALSAAAVAGLYADELQNFQAGNVVIPGGKLIMPISYLPTVGVPALKPNLMMRRHLRR